MRRWSPVARLDHIDGWYRFTYTFGARTLPGFRPFPEMPKLEGVYESETLFPLFANRLLSSSRPEYEAFLRWGGFDVAEAPDPIAILGVTEGIRQTDSIEVFPCPVPDANGRYSSRFFLHGLRYMNRSAVHRVSQLRCGEILYPLLDEWNDADRFAVALRTGEPSSMIGYVPRYLARDLRRLLGGTGSRQIVVDRVNSDATMQYRLLCTLHASWPDDFRPCNDEEFLPIADVPACRSVDPLSERAYPRS